MHMQVKADYTKHIWHKTRYGQLSEGNHGHCGIQMTDHAYGLFLDQELVPCRYSSCCCCSCCWAMLFKKA